MRIKNIAIGIQSAEEGVKEFVEAVDAIRSGKVPRGKKEGVYFTSLEAMRRVLTPKRLGLLHLIREKAPESISELSRMAKRNLKNVQDDLAMLARIGLVSLSRVKAARDRVVPRVGYDRLQLQIPMI